MSSPPVDVKGLSELRKHTSAVLSLPGGTPAKSDGEGKLLTVHFQGLSDPVETDIAGGNKLFFRSRGPWARFFALHKPKAGDHVTIERLGAYEYRVRPGS
jgi:hypothetical protein